MAPKERKEHTAALKAHIEAQGFTQDRYGHLKREAHGIVERFKFGRIGLRREVKHGPRWIRVRSAPISKVTLSPEAPYGVRF